jgi:hypothetical protein
MAMTPTGIARTVGLWVLILADSAMLVTLYLTHNYVWFAVFLFITIWIISAEIYGMIVGLENYEGERQKMTISTNYKKYIQKVGWIGYVPLALFWIAMTGLVVHLAFW